MRAIVVVVLISALFIFFQTKRLGQYTLQYSAAVGAQAPAESSAFLSSYSFSEVFGVANATDATPKPAPSNDKPPPIETWLSDPSSFIPDDANVIPRIINKIYFQKGSGYPSAKSMPANLKKAHESWQSMNPGYDIRYYDLDQARKYLHQHFHPVFLRAFDCLPAFAAKSDLFRMTLLYREGGFHSDWKQQCLQLNALQNISEATDFFAAYDMWDSNDFFKHKCVQNALVGSKPQHPILAKMLEMLLLNIQTSHYSGTALDATATCILGRAIHVSEAERNSTWFAKVAGNFVNAPPLGGCYKWNGQLIVQHKCDDCGGAGQDWGDTGNNYIELYKRRNFYCQDAASLFRTTVSF
ncbi:hypothetical protein ACHAXR_005171 [Thalassiosira sp. AJA248-18]